MCSGKAEMSELDIDAMRRIIRKMEVQRTGACPARLGIDQLKTTVKCRPKTAEESNRKTYLMTQQPSLIRARWRSRAVGIFTWSLATTRRKAMTSQASSGFRDLTTWWNVTFIRPMANWNRKGPEHRRDDR